MSIFYTKFCKSAIIFVKDNKNYIPVTHNLHHISV